MEQAQQDVQKLAQDTKAKIQQNGQKTLDDIKQIPPQVWGVAVGIAFLFSFILHVVTKTSEDKIMTFGVIFYALVVGACSVFLRNNELKDQLTTVIVLLSFVRVFFDIAPTTLLFLASNPFIVNFVVAEGKARNLIPK